MWRVVVFVILGGHNPTMTPLQHTAVIKDTQTEIGKTQCHERAPDFIENLNDIYGSMKPSYAYKCVYEGERV